MESIQTRFYKALEKKDWQEVTDILQADNHRLDVAFNNGILSSLINMDAPEDVITQLIFPHNINVLDQYGHTVLHQAVKKERWTLVSLLLKHNVDVNLCNVRKETPLHWAASLNAPADIITQLISSQNINMQDRFSRTTLHIAVEKQRWEMVTIFIQHGANVNLGDAAKATSLHSATSKNAPLDVITQLISARNINMQNKGLCTSLHLALGLKRWELVEILLEHGADINVCDGRNMTPLHWAASFNAPIDIITRLISPSNINLLNSSADTALYLAMRGRSWQQVPVLIDHGALSNFSKADNATALHWALIFRAPDDLITQLISSHSRCINLADETGKTPLSLSLEEERWNLVPVLLQYGADPTTLRCVKPERSLKAMCIRTIRNHLPIKSDQAYDGLGLPGRLVSEVKLMPQAEEIVQLNEM